MLDRSVRRRTVKRGSNGGARQGHDCASQGDVLKTLAGCHNIVVWSGSGLSATSGMSMFSTRNGLYDRARKQFKIQDGIKLFTYSFYSKRRAEVQGFFAQIYSEARDSQAAPGHQALAVMANLGRVKRHYTLNIDGLSDTVGLSTWHHESNPAGNTVQLHGNIRELVCPSCHAVEPLGDAHIHTMKALQMVPCAACREDSLRFKVMLYDDAEGDCVTPEHVFETLEEDLQVADCVLWVGISFEQSASVEYFRRVRSTLASQGRLDAVVQAIVNPSEDAHFNVLSCMCNADSLKLLDVRAKADEFLPLLASAMAARKDLEPLAGSAPLSTQPEQHQQAGQPRKRAGSHGGSTACKQQKAHLGGANDAGTDLGQVHTGSCHVTHHGGHAVDRCTGTLDQQQTHMTLPAHTMAQLTQLQAQAGQQCSSSSSPPQELPLQPSQQALQLVPTNSAMQQQPHQHPQVTMPPDGIGQNAQQSLTQANLRQGQQLQFAAPGQKCQQSLLPQLQQPAWCGQQQDYSQLCNTTRTAIHMQPGMSVLAGPALCGQPQLQQGLPDLVQLVPSIPQLGPQGLHALASLLQRLHGVPQLGVQLHGTQLQSLGAPAASLVCTAPATRPTPVPQSPPPVQLLQTCSLMSALTACKQEPVQQVEALPVHPGTQLQGSSVLQQVEGHVSLLSERVELQPELLQHLRSAAKSPSLLHN